MTNKEFFIETIDREAPIFKKVLQALPATKLDFKPGEKARTAGRIAFQLASQAFFIAAIAAEGKPDWGTYREPENPNLPDMLALMEKNFANLKIKLAGVSDYAWENETAVLEFPGGKWETKKYDMAWGFLFDAIHHRGQLTSYLRAMGAKVPSVYGGSADERPQA
jgi:uncharacterized damage-inducible protein DinB